MMQGTPYIYQGEEIGMTNIYLDSIDEYEDIETLTAYYQRTKKMGEDPDYMFSCIQKKSRDNARTAMQWDSSEYAGFGKNGGWFKVNPNYKEINAASQVNDPDSIYSYYKRLIRLRKQYPIIVYGDFTPLFEDSEENYCYIRTLSDEKLLVLCSFSEKEQVISLPEEFCNRTAKQLISNYYSQSCLVSDIKTEQAIRLAPYEAKVIYFN